MELNNPLLETVKQKRLSKQIVSWCTGDRHSRKGIAGGNLARDVDADHLHVVQCKIHVDKRVQIRKRPLALVLDEVDATRALRLNELSFKVVSTRLHVTPQVRHAMLLHLLYPPLRIVVIAPGLLENV